MHPNGVPVNYWSESRIAIRAPRPAEKWLLGADITPASKFRKFLIPARHASFEVAPVRFRPEGAATIQPRAPPGTMRISPDRKPGTGGTRALLPGAGLGVAPFQM